MNAIGNITPEPITLHSLATSPRFVAWRNEERNGKLTKVPYDPGTGRMAKADDARTWSDRATAEAAAVRLVGDLGGGVGIELGDLGDGRAIGGIDLDTCRSADGEVQPWALAVVEQFGTYAEISPSGTGLKTFFSYPATALPELRRAMQTEWGKQWKRGGGEHPPAVEIYLGGRYFAITDQHLAGTPLDLRLVTVEALLQLIRQDGPAFARGRRDAAPKAEHAGSGNDSSRSATALRKGASVRRIGGTFEQMVQSLLDDPITADWAREKGQANGQRELRRIWDKAAPATSLDGFDLTEDGVALAFTKAHHNQLRFCHSTGAWFQWTGWAWRKDETKLAFSWARQICRKLVNEGSADEKERVTLAKASAAGAVERFAQSDRVFAVTAAIWDADPFLLGTPTGTLDLRTGQLREPVQDDYITKLTSVGPARVPDCPLWLQFLWETTGGDAGLIRFLRQWCGYILSGDTREHALLFIFGPGGNGKSIWLNTVSAILGEYARTAAMETFAASQSDRHPTDLAMLRGARMVSASETEEGRAWAEVRIKQLTGGDTITARFMRQDFFEFRPQFKLTVIGNHKPVLRNVDEAARRRFNVVPFIRKPAKPDRDLEHKLHAEWPAILRWMVEGCLDWQQNGLVRPKVVLEATAAYFAEQDELAHWLEECCEQGNACEDTTASLFASWHNYARSRGEDPGSAKRFTTAMQRQGFLPIRDPAGARNQRGFRGVKVRFITVGDES